MLQIARKIYIFNIAEVWFSDSPFEVSGCDAVTFHACKNKVDMPGFDRENFTTLVIDLTLDLDTIWGGMSKSSCRYAIKRARRDGVKIKLNENFEEFYEINRSFRKVKGLPAGFDTVATMEKYGTLFVTEHGGRVLAGQLYLEDENNIRWLLGASKRLEVSKEEATLIGNANRLMIWEAINYAKQKGLREFDFGGVSYTGGGEPPDPVDAFKLSFGGKMDTKYIYRKDYSGLYKLLKKIYQWRYGTI
jgi:lipid II:glycine glycyltransferase (peptidoglycan interpeptide bridge formation enzyme)